MKESPSLSRIELFQSVVLAGSFSRAAARLGMPKSRVSRNIARLERELGLPLFYRTTRQFRLTDAGAALYQRTAPLLRELRTTLDEASTGAEAIAGPLRFTVPEDIGTELMGRLCREFLELHPKVELSLHASNQLVDLVRDAFDLAVRIGPARDSTLIRRKIGSVSLLLAAAPALIARHGLPTRPEPLGGWPFLSFSGGAGRRPALPVTNGKDRLALRPTAAFSANNFFVLRRMAQEGAGFAALPAFLARESFAAGTLVPLLKEWYVESDPVQILVPRQKGIPPRVRALSDFLAQRLGSIL